MINDSVSDRDTQQMGMISVNTNAWLQKTNIYYIFAEFLGSHCKKRDFKNVHEYVL